MAQQQGNEETIKAWADIVIERFEYKIVQLKITDSGELLRSFVSQVYSDANGDAQKVTLAFLYYGRFSDMGVGRGVKHGEAGMGNNRRVKPWMSKVLFGQIHQLGRILAEKTGEEAAITIVETIQHNQ